MPERLTADAGVGSGSSSGAHSPAWRLAEVLLATGGRLLGMRWEAVFNKVSTDTRGIEPGDLFVALAGDRFDGHDFISMALQKGAAGVIVSKPPADALPVPVVMVPDTQRALGDLAGYRRGHLPGLRVIGITGSSGKTTVKEMTAAIMATRFRILKTQGNFNNLVGLPLSLLPVDAGHQVAVLEMGMNQPGEIARLTEIADPDVACIVNVQGAHLAGLKDIGGVARAKGELFDNLKGWGRMAVNMDDPQVRKLARRHRQMKITFGRRANAQVRGTHVRNRGEEGMDFTLHVGAEQARVRLKCLGEHNVLNALAAAAIAHGLKVGLNDIVAGLENFRPYDKRMQVVRAACGLKVVNDTYNANPASMLAALQALKGVSRDRRTLVVLGDMLELGQQSEASHRLIGESAAAMGFDYLYAVGEYAATVVEGARNAGMPASRVAGFADKEELARAIGALLERGGLGEGDWALVKGSRGMGMETVVQAMMNLKK